MNCCVLAVRNEASVPGINAVSIMTIRKRSAVLLIFIVLASALYGVAKYNSNFLVEYVVEKTMIQKAPAGTDPAKIRKYLQALLSAEPDRQSRTDLLFRISRDLEKIQVLSPQALADLLKVEKPEVLKM